MKRAIPILEKVRRVARGLQPVFGLEDVGGYGRSLAVFLLEKSQAVKEVNAALSYTQRISHPTTQKSDSWDAFCMACVLLARLEELSDANPQDVYWTLGQLVNKRDALVKASSTLQNQLHTQLSHHYPKLQAVLQRRRRQGGTGLLGKVPGAAPPGRRHRAGVGGSLACGQSKHLLNKEGGNHPGVGQGRRGDQAGAPGLP